MAIMIPQAPKEFKQESLEGEMFKTLENKLSNEYYVFHSFRIISKREDKIIESEADFIIFNPEKGIMVLEAKAGKIKCENGIWKYSNGDIMKYHGPYEQAIRGKWKLYEYMREGPSSKFVSDIANRCKLIHAVWFPSVSKHDLDFKVMPTEAETEVTLTKDDLVDPSVSIEHIFSLNFAGVNENNLSERDITLLLRHVLCPTFDIIPSINMESDLNKQVFLRMLDEQKNILNYLSFQRTAAIQGIAGTGKTLIALEKARRHAQNEEKVLFICYNSMLHKYISSNNRNDYIDFYTMDGYACKLCNSERPNYEKVRSVLETYYLERNFPYKHIIIDEGQDLGQENIEENDIVSWLKDIIIDTYEDGSFYIFYDGMQHVQGKKIPECIMNADCRLTLYKNCRNTENIAKTSMKPLGNDKIKLIDGCIIGKVPKLYYCDENNNHIKQVAKAIENLKVLGIRDIVILTCKTEGTSALKNEIINGKYHDKYNFTSCRKFKGLEADAIILVDVDKDTLSSNVAKVFYVGASRARINLSIVATLNDEECEELLKQYSINGKVRNPKKRLATELNTLMVSNM